MSEPVRDGTIECCHFCGCYYIERWPVEVLAVTACPGCCSLSLLELAKRYPRKTDELLATYVDPDEVHHCECGGECGEDCDCKG